jgi:two-component system, NarL family, invasion response regulator UvrY
MVGQSERSVELPPVRVVVVDDHAAFRAAARDVVAATSGFRLVGEATTGHEALRAVEQLGPELLLLDVHMPGMDGIEVARRVSSSHPGTLIVLVSTSDPRTLSAAAPLKGIVAMERKEDLCPGRLRELWAAGPGR